MSAVSWGNRVCQTVSDYALPIGGVGVAVAVAGVAASSVAVVVTGLALAVIAAVVRYLYPPVGPRHGNQAAAVVAVPQNPPQPRPNAQPVQQAAPPPPRSRSLDPKERWDFALLAPTEENPRVEKTVSFAGKTYQISLRWIKTNGESFGWQTRRQLPFGYEIFINDLPVINADATTERVTELIKPKTPLASRKWIVQTGLCHFEMSYRDGLLHIQTGREWTNDLVEAPAMRIRELEAPSDPRYYEVFPPRKAGFKLTPAPFPMTQEEAEKAAAPHHEAAEVEACHLKTALIACFHSETGFFFQGAPENTLRRVVPVNQQLMWWYDWISQEKSYRIQVCDTHSFQVDIQVEPDDALTVWFNNSPGGFLGGSQVQKDSLQSYRGTSDSLGEPLSVKDVIAMILNYAFPPLVAYLASRRTAAS